MQKRIISAATVLLLSTSLGWNGAYAQLGGTPAATSSPQEAVYFSHGDMDTVWKELETKNAINKRVVDAGKYSINIRSIRETDAPLVHSKSIDIWIMEEGSATAITGGTLINPVKKPNVDDLAGTSIEGGTERTFLPGDILYVPAGVPHAFKNVKGFRAYLIRVDLE
jgi:mannose-6-phosphate isomerase-like protein (cupin superfamily)